MNTPRIIGNLCSLLAMGTDAISSTRKTPKAMLWMQTLSQVIYFIGTVVLGGYSGAVQNAVSILRNLVAIRKISNQVLEWTLVGLGVVFGLVFNNLGLAGLLPVIANLQYTLAVFRFRDNERALKIAFVISVGMFAVFNVVIYNYVGAVSNGVVCVTALIALIKGTKRKETTLSEQEETV